MALTETNYGYDIFQLHKIVSIFVFIIINMFFPGIPSLEFKGITGLFVTDPEVTTVF